MLHAARTVTNAVEEAVWSFTRLLRAVFSTSFLSTAIKSKDLKMSCIHYKFSNTVENDKIKFDGLAISVSDLREAIIKQKGLKSNQYTLRIIDSQTKKEYTDAKEMLPRNTSVVVSRAPMVNAQRVPKARFKDPTLPQSDSLKPSALPGTMVVENSKMLTAEELKKTADLVNANATEEEKVKAMMIQSTGDGYDQPSQYVWTPRGNSTGALPGLKKNPPPPGYTCNRCGIRGHWIQLCPTNGDPNFNFNRYKRPTGTPISQIVAVTEDIPGVMVDRHGQLVVRAVDLKALQDFRSKKKKQQVSEEAPKEVKPPPELICGICKELMKDAVIIPCCGESYCYECIQDHLCENEFTCPGCKKENISPDNLAPNKALRMSAKNFRMKEAEDKSVAAASTRGFVKKEAVVVVKPPVVTTANKVSVTELVGSTSPVGAGKGEVSGVPEIVKEDGKVTPPKVAESAERADSSPISGQDVFGIAKVDHRVAKSRSGSPANVVNPIVAPIVVSRPEAKQQSSLATISLSGMHTGIPLTNAGLLGGTSLAPNFLGAHYAALYPHQMLSVPSSMLPGQTGLVPTQPAPPKATSSDPTKLDKLAAELLLNTAMSTKKRASPSPPPPLSQDDFYRHQKILKLFTKPGHRGNSGGSSSSYSSGSYSHSSSSASSLYSRSRSRSPHHTRSKGTTHHMRSKHKHERLHEHAREKREKRVTKGHEVKVHKDDRDGKKEISKHYHGKRKRHDSPTAVLVDRKTKPKRRRSRSRSPKTLSLEEVPNVLVSGPSTAVNTPSDVGSLVMADLLPSPVEVSESSTQRERKHKKKGKKKHKHRRREEGEGGVEEEGRGAAVLQSVVASGVTESPRLEVRDGLLEQPPSPAAEAGDSRKLSSSPKDDSPGEAVGVTDGKELSSPVESGGAEGEGLSANSEPPSVEGALQTSQESDTEVGVVTSREDTGIDSEMGVAEVFVATSQEDAGVDCEVGVAEMGVAEVFVATSQEVAAVANSETEVGSRGATGVVGVALGEEAVEETMEISVHVLDSALLEEDATEFQGDGGEEAVPGTPPSPPPLPPPPLTKEDLPEILDQLEGLVDDKWQDFGLELHVPGRKLTQMQQRYPMERLERVILHWLEHSMEENCSWAYLVEALKSMGKKSLAHRISKKHLPARKEEGEISDSEDGGAELGRSQKSEDLPDLRETLNNSAQLLSGAEPDLRETINSHKTAISRKRQAPLLVEEDQEREGSEGEEEGKGYTISKQSTKRRKMSHGKVKNVAGNAYSRGYSSSTGSDTDSSSSSSESEEEDKFSPVVVKSSKPKRKHSSSKKHTSREKSRSKVRERTREKKPKKEKKHRSSREHKHSSKSSHKPKRTSRVERADKRAKKVKKQKKTSRSDRHH